MDKKKLLQAVCARLEKDLVVLKAAAAQSYDAATNEESRPENEYDTRALESSYLAGAQAHRVKDTEAALTIFKFVEIRSFDADTPIGPTALVRLSLNDKESTVFILPTGGGVTVAFEGRSIQVLTAKSPLGEALQGLKEGDAAIVEKGEQTLEYEIIAVE
ncbi:MAG TPA: hypothetical protein PL182_10590 [Pseudobdellovibrionaceae bacterium]|nr:hypothetical protein [Pseudobdellovibrionaceae bacterium]